MSKDEKKKCFEIENLFMRRAQSHEIMIMLFRGEHMGNQNSMFYVQFLNFLCYSFLFHRTCGWAVFLRRTPNKSWGNFLSHLKIFSWLNVYDSNAD